MNRRRKILKGISLEKYNSNNSTFMFKSIFSGIMIAFGCLIIMIVKTDPSLPPSVNSLLSGIVFSVGLFAIIMSKGELFTGNMLMVLGLYDAKKNIPDERLINKLLLCYLGNFIGVVIIAILTHLLNYKIDAISAIAYSKFNSTSSSLFINGILCNFLVCLSVWLSFSEVGAINKFVCIIVPITTFVACGFEHSIADMFFMLFTNFSLHSFCAVLIVSIGNICGGLLFDLLIAKSSKNMEDYYATH